MDRLKAILLLNGFTVTTLVSGVIQAVKGTQDWYIMVENGLFTMFDERGDRYLSSTPAEAAREILLESAFKAMAA